MGNCLVHQYLEDEKKKKVVVKLMRVDGEVLQYPSSTSLKVREVLSHFPGHAVAESLPVVRHLDTGGDLLGGKLYYLLPPKRTTTTTTVHESSEEEEAGGGAGARMVRIKVVVSKQELKEMLCMGAAGKSLAEMMAKLRRRTAGPAGIRGGGRGRVLRPWRPVLASIPEGNDFFC